MKILRSLIFSILITFFIILPVSAADSHYEFSKKSLTLFIPGDYLIVDELQAKDGKTKIPEDLNYSIKKAGESSSIDLPKTNYMVDISKTYGFYWMGNSDYPFLYYEAGSSVTGSYIVTATFTDNGTKTTLELPVEVKSSSITGIRDVKLDNISILNPDPSDSFGTYAPVLDASKVQTYKINYDLEPSTAKPSNVTYELSGDYGCENWASINQTSGTITLKSSTPKFGLLNLTVYVDGFSKGGTIKISGLPVIPPKDVDKLKHVYFGRNKGQVLPMTYTVKDSDKNGLNWDFINEELNCYPGASYEDSWMPYSTEYLLESGALVFTSEKGTVKYDKDTGKLTFTGKPGDIDKLYLMCGNNSSLSTPQDPEGEFGYITIIYPKSSNDSSDTPSTHPGTEQKPGSEQKPGASTDQNPGSEEKPGNEQKPDSEQNPGTSTDQNPGSEEKPGNEQKPGTGQKPETSAKSVPIYRLYNSANNEHLYTSDLNEKNVLSAQSDWTYEGIGWKAPTTGDPVYRLYSPITGNHLYTTDENEKNVLINERGWSADNNGAPLYYSGGSVPIYRVYHEELKQHHLTTDVNEYNVLGSQGWNQEGVKLKAASLN